MSTVTTADISTRRVLGIDRDLPTLTNSARVDEELYALLALVLRDFIQTWYGAITQDETFIQEIILVVAHILSRLEQRLRETNVETLLLEELPALLQLHVRTYRSARRLFSTAISGHLSFEEFFRSLMPHPALRSAEAEELYYQRLAEGIAELFVPPDDLLSDCGRSLVIDILSNLVLGTAVSKLSDPYVYHELIHKNLSQEHQELPKLQAPRFGCGELVRSWSRQLADRYHSAPEWAGRLWMYMQSGGTKVQPSVMSSPLFSLICELLCPEDHGRWLWSVIRLCLVPIIVAVFGGAIEKAYADAVRPLLRDPEVWSRILKTGREALWPNGAMTPKMAPDEAERMVMKRTAHEAVLNRFPRAAAILLGGSEITNEFVEELLDTVEHQSCNKGVALFVLDAILARCLPELVS
ncbi:hypothetical protein SAICODRAFT_73050 [Saitoella complicata NRRL Y-17804]|uniref:uncharacterized protein n=1 Tax=Saitoella complicata (strain BCRC 22490 / CBS 7301 / JCM 7358 / NBRC 10748 / NRRL Y-17804) TaxID=698492 RepID=UPI0008678ED0|nr:uncharacterized protein SAICODRAFT_73050 [Saitoella complicata NRRL Y-17804]ODQ50839.1 hypothetical protein SAICODRAFT_73050 [Saitoella complicata NRRL Y-17804]